ncbi:hypothetical protein BGW38_010195, partial [Lunasporangiospora selenospora]
RPLGPSTYDSSLNNLDIQPSPSSPSVSADSYQAQHGMVNEAPPRARQAPQFRNPQHREETDLERRLRIEQQEIEQLELENLIKLKKLNVERLLEEKRQSQSFYDQSQDQAIS